MKIIVYILVIVISCGMISCESTPQKVQSSETNCETKAKQELPPYKTHIAEVNFTQPLKDLRFYDQILEIHNNHIRTWKTTNFDSRNVLVMIGKGDSQTILKSIREHLLKDQKHGNRDGEIFVHFLVRNLRSKNLGTLILNCNRQTSFGCGSTSPNRNVIINDSTISISGNLYSISDPNFPMDSTIKKGHSILKASEFNENYNWFEKEAPMSFIDSSRLDTIINVISQLSEKIPLFTEHFYLEFSTHFWSPNINQIRKRNMPHFQTLMTVISKVKEYENQNQITLQNFVTNYNNSNSSLSFNEINYLKKKTSIPIFINQSPPPPPPPPPPKELKGDWIDENEISDINNIQ